MAWIALLAAAGGEILWTYTLKASEGFSRPGITVLNILTMMVTAWLLALSTKELPLGTAYTLWTGFGVVGTVAMSIAFFGETVGTGKLLAIGMIVVGTVMLKFTEG